MNNEEMTGESAIKEEQFSYDGYQVVRGEFFAHLFEPSVTFKDAKVFLIQYVSKLFVDRTVFNETLFIIENYRFIE